jgi:hypothetical protein
MGIECIVHYGFLHISYNHNKADLLNGYDVNVTIWLNVSFQDPVKLLFYRLQKSCRELFNGYKLSGGNYHSVYKYHGGL